jgi:hypothetical protein
MRALFLIVLVVLAAPCASAEPWLRSGDLVFQTSRSAQSVAIQRATHSPYSHVGIVEVTARGTFVLEAIGPVSKTAWTRWRARGEGAKVTVLRPRGLTARQIDAVLTVAHSFLGRPYDPEFRWGDEQLYCSELVELAFERGAGLHLGQIQRLGELDVSPVRDALVARYGRVPLELELITPASIAADPKLDRVYSDF